MKRSRLKRGMKSGKKSRLQKIPKEIREELDRTQVGVIAGISGHPMSGLWELNFADGSSAHIESGFGVRTLAQAFGATEGAGDLQEKIKGKKIAYVVDEYGIFTVFTPYGEFIDSLKAQGYYDYWKSLGKG